MISGAIRRPAVAGYFYPEDPAALRACVVECAGEAVASEGALAVVVPHGSYRQSGPVAGAAFSRVRIPRRCVILAPSHTPTWLPWSVMVAGVYRTPLGDVPVDAPCAEALRRRCPFLDADAWAQFGEHAVEVQLPFLQRFGPTDLTVVPIVIGSDDCAEFLQLAEALVQVIRMQEEHVLLIASSDLSHYQPAARTEAQDRCLLDAICALEGPTLIQRVREDGIAMCGYGAVATVLSAARGLGAVRGECVAYRTSADAGGDPDAAVGYAGVLIR